MQSKFSSRHLTIALKLIVSIAAAELLIMTFFNVFHIESMLSRTMISLTDTFLLSLAASVMIFVWVVKPMKSAEEYHSVESRGRLSEKRYRSLFESSMDAIYITEREGPFLEVNQATLDLFGYTREEMIGMDVRRIYANPDDRYSFRQEIEKQGYLRDYEVCFINREGHELNCLLSSTVLFDDDGNVLGYQGIIRDVTERKRMETALRESEAWLRTIFEASQSGILLVDPEGKITFANERMAEMFGCTHEEIIGTFYPDLLLASEKAIGEKKMRQLISGEIEHIITERHYQRKDGTDFWGYLSGRRLMGPDGRLKTLVGIITDITDLKKMENQVYQAKQDWEETFNTITDMITVHDRDFNIVAANRAAQEILGLPFLEKSSAKCYEYYHGTGCPPEACPSCQVMKTALPSTTETFEPHLKKFIEIRAIPRRDKNNALIGLIHVVRDITERKKLEDQLRQAQKMEAIGQLAGGVAHDFNNILSAIMGYGHLLRMKMDDNDPLRNYVEQTLEASERAATLTHSLLAFSRKQMISLKLVNLNELVKRFEKFLLRLIREDIEFKTVCSDENITVMADTGQIEQVLMNLVANARDAMPDAGRLTIGTGLVHIEDEFMKIDGHGKAGDYAVITVSDTGIGMDEKTREKIFEPFFTTKEQGKGTGLGLSMVYGIIKQHGGYVTVYSEPGQGTTFKIYLPFVRPHAGAETAEEHKESVPLRGGSETILIAEDDEALRKLASTVMGQFGYQVIEAVDGEDAVLKFIENKDRIQLVILDAIMPKKNGRQAYDEISAIAPNVKTLFASGYSADVISPTGVLEKGMHFINKPVSPADLLRKVRGVLDA
ncbi:MAG: PAS domain S-box protein [Nitrospirae bacterium]|nr:PAS domain S-box protein [Nitrospirota bacterium]